MSYIKEPFGKAPDGKDVFKYTLTNENGVSASFTDLGGIWLGMAVPDRNGRMEDVVLGWGSAEECLKNSGHLGEIIGRNANRTGGAAFTLNGTVYHLGKNSGENNIHSGPDYYRNRVWKTSVSEYDGNISAAFSLTSPDGDQGFPGNADILVTYTLTADDALEINYIMTCDADTAANFTNHVYFNLAGHAAGDIGSHIVWIDADGFTAADANSVPTGEIIPVKGTPMDFTVPKAIGCGIDSDYAPIISAGGYDHNWALNHAPAAFSLSAYVMDPVSGRKMEVYTDMPGVQFYTANNLKPAVSKDGHTVYAKRGGYCFETQFFPDSLNRPEFPSPVLRNWEVFNSTTVYRFTAV